MRWMYCSMLACCSQGTASRRPLNCFARQSSFFMENLEAQELKNFCPSSGFRAWASSWFGVRTTATNIRMPLVLLITWQGSPSVDECNVPALSGVHEPSAQHVTWNNDARAVFLSVRQRDCKSLQTRMHGLATGCVCSLSCE